MAPPELWRQKIWIDEEVDPDPAATNAVSCSGQGLAAAAHITHRVEPYRAISSEPNRADMPGAPSMVGGALIPTR